MPESVPSDLFLDLRSVFFLLKNFFLTGPSSRIIYTFLRKSLNIRGSHIFICMDLNLMSKTFNKVMPKSYDDIAKYSNMVMDHEVLDGKIKSIELDFEPSKEPIKYGGYEMIHPGTLIVNVFLNTESFYKISDSISGIENAYKLIPELEVDSFLEFNGYEFIKNIIFPYISQKFLRLMGLSFGDIPYVDFNLINHKGEILLSYDEDLETFVGSKNSNIWKKIS